MLKSLKRKIVLSFRATRTFGDTTQNIHPKTSGLLGGVFGGLPKPLSQELFVAPRHGVAIKGGADLTLTGSGFVYPAVRRPWRGPGWMIGVVIGG